MTRFERYRIQKSREACILFHGTENKNTPNNLGINVLRMRSNVLDLLGGEPLWYFSGKTAPSIARRASENGPFLRK